MTKRLLYIDIAKGLCILLVVIGHYMPMNAPEWYIAMREIIYYFHMPLFMFVSGFVYRKSNKPIPYKQFILKKADRLLLPYFVVSVLIILLKMIGERGLTVDHPVTLHSFIEMFYLPSAGFFLWFVYVLFLIFLVIPFFDTNKKMNGLLFFSFCLLLLPVEFPAICCLNQLKAMLFYFVLGCFFSQYEQFRLQVVRIPLVVHVILFAGLFVMLRWVWFDLSAFPHAVIALCLALIGISIITHLSRFIENANNRMTQWTLQLSVYSYMIYLFHTTFQGFAKALLQRLSFQEQLGHDVWFAISICVVNVVGIVGPILVFHLYYGTKRVLREKSALRRRQ